MKRFFIVAVCCVLLYACRPGIPKDIIQPEEMEKVLLDIHVVDGYAATMYSATNDSLKKTIQPYYKGIYMKYGIDSALYTKSLNYYYKHPEVLKAMYVNITQRLLTVKDKIAKEEAKAPAPAELQEKKQDTVQLKSEKSVQ